MMNVRRFLLTGVLLALVLTVKAQVSVSGIVTDRQTHRPLPHVSVSIENGDVHTVTNEDGRFTLKTTVHPKYVQLSHISYKTQRVPIGDVLSGNLHIEMTKSTVMLDEIVVSSDNPLEILKAAMQRIEKNYPRESELVRCFYRETARKGSRYILVAEAVADMYKTDYTVGPDFDAVGILKGRRLISMKSRDTLGVKIQGGPVMPLMVDVAKNPDYLLNMEMLLDCNLRMELPTAIDNRLHYVIGISPKRFTIQTIMGGLLYIDKETLAITRAELELDVSDWRKAADYMLVRKPLGLHFRPKKLSVTVGYETDQQGVTRMNYVRNEMRFNCDWKRRLFASPFTTVSEMVVTNRLQHGKAAKKPRGRSSFGIRDRFYDKVEYFEDPDFWADYNIIEPSESLEHAIGKLKKRLSD